MELTPEDIAAMRRAVMLLEGLERGGAARDLNMVVEKVERGQHSDT